MNKRQMSFKPMQQQGFTLIELMISLVLGLLVIAAATGIFLSAQRSMNMQTGMSELQQNSIFGLSQITHDLRHVNLNTSPRQSIFTYERGAGIILMPNTALVSVPQNWITAENVTATNMNVNSDRLTIQYKPNSRDLVNCEGEQLNDPDRVNVQSYFIRQVPNSNPARYELRCSAIYRAKTQFDAGTVLLSDVEAFKVRFGVQNYTVQNRVVTRNNGFRYKTIGQLSLNANTEVDRIVSIEIGIVARSNSSVGSGSGTDVATTFQVLGNNIQLRNTENEDRFLREAFSQVVSIRNAQGF